MGKRKTKKRVTTRRYLRVFSQAYINTGAASSMAYNQRATPPSNWNDIVNGNNEGRKAALVRSVAIMLEDVPKDNFISVLEVQGRCVRLYYNGDRTKWFFVRKTDTAVDMQSMTFPSRAIAERMWNDGHVNFEIRNLQELVPA